MLTSRVCSFRDPAGTLICSGDRVFRAVNAEGLVEAEAFLKTSLSRAAMKNGQLVSTVRISPDKTLESVRWAEAVYEHERIPFPSYPYEWPPEMLHAAGELTLELARKALHEGFGLKDATPYNVLFRGPKPVFIDLLSFERRDPLDPTWLPYAQFARTFLLPLIAEREFGISLDRVLAGQRDGLEPETVYRWASWRQRLKPGFLGFVTLPAWLGRRSQDSTTYQPKHASSAEQARFIVARVLNSCLRSLRRLRPRLGGQSTWTGYLAGKSLYTADQLGFKEAFVRDALLEAKPRTVLDVGANEGLFSELAANCDASVVAIDSDPAVVGRVWRLANDRELDILPLVVDLTRPSPAMGWRNQECSSFLDRARGRFDLVLMLAVIHHMLVTERVPLGELLDLAAELTREFVLIEFVGPKDTMFRRIARGRDKLYEHLTKEYFEIAAEARFEVLRCRRIEGLERWLYLLRRRAQTI